MAIKILPLPCLRLFACNHLRPRDVLIIYSTICFSAPTRKKGSLNLSTAMSYCCSSLSSKAKATSMEEDCTGADPLHVDEEKVSLATRYHNQTKHSFTSYARGPHGLDWANQPNPFRRYPPSELLPLLHSPFHNETELTTSAPIYQSIFNALPFPRPVSHSTISQFFYESFALSAWKSTGYSTWSLRVNPSSGNLHPTEAYLISPAIDSLCNSPFVAHYATKEHSLEVRANIRFDFFSKFFPKNCFLIGISSIFWREAWKYGERAFRYCNHDVGHALAAVSIAAAGLGWDVKMLDGLSYKELELLMGLEKYQDFRAPESEDGVKGKFPDIEFEHPDCVLVVFPSNTGEFCVDYEGLRTAIRGFANLEWKGKPNTLSKEHVCWNIIYKTAEAVKKPLTVLEHFSVEPFRSSIVCCERAYKGFNVTDVVRKRRSAVDMDGITKLERETFYQVLLHCLPSGSGCKEKQKKPMALPFRALSWEAEVHTVLFVHRVTSLPRGIYFLVRNENHLDKLKQAMRREFSWEKPEGCPDELPLFQLARGDCQQIAKRLCCHQDIASDGCFSLGMVAHFEHALKCKGAWMYPRLFWETGVLGQVLYLEAHAIGLSATGIGCFFDDSVHQLLGLTNLDFQSLYHFTVGGPVQDKRIMSLPAYPGPKVDA